MRITGGNAARRILKVPKGLDVRPTPDLVKQAVFNSLGARVEGAKVLELFAGSGALSLECLSRGAVAVMSVEKSHRHAEFIRSNAESAGYGEMLEVRTQDVFPVMKQLAKSGRQFDLILADPPYGEKNVNRRSTSFAQQLLDDQSLPKLLAPGGRFVLGHTKRDTLDIVAPWTELKLLKHGDTLMRFFEIGAS
ncbi:MAG: RsmD family RNA methyltransferase [Verrucomicrobiota bacterium]|jgi:16S rRNA (guanine966-N2)-methyltransferase